MLWFHSQWLGFVRGFGHTPLPTALIGTVRVRTTSHSIDVWSNSAKVNIKGPLVIQFYGYAICLFFTVTIWSQFATHCLLCNFLKWILYLPMHLFHFYSINNVYFISFGFKDSNAYSLRTKDISTTVSLCTKDISTTVIVVNIIIPERDILVVSYSL